MHRRSEAVQRIFAVVAVFFVFARVDLHVVHLNVGLIAAVALAPVWMGVLPRFVGARLLVLLTLLSLASGGLLIALSPQRGISVGPMLDTVFGLVGFAGSVCVVLWARTLVPAPIIAVTIGFAMLATVSATSGLYAENPWKFGFSTPVTVVVLGLAWWLRSWWVEFACLAILALISASTDSRSNFGFLVLAAALLVWQFRSRGPVRASQSWVPSVVVLAALAYAIYEGAQSLILNGYLGQATQVRSEAQLDASGSLLLGGRPELAATVALMKHFPGGFGIGVLPSSDQINVAKSAMASINYDPNNGYVERFMFGTHFELHSVIGDMWAQFGLVGLATAIFIMLVGVRGAAIELRSGAASALVLYLTIQMCWGMLFSPFGTAASMALLLGLVIPLRTRGAVSDLDDRVENRRGVSLYRKPGQGVLTP